MNPKLEYYCETCHTQNRTYLGEPNFELKQSEFYSFGDAVKHIIETQHEVTASIVIDEND